MKLMSVAGLEPAIPRSEVWCLVHYATRSLTNNISEGINKV